MIFDNFLKETFNNGPPDAVRNTLFIFDKFFLSKAYHIEKCSESTGINFVLYLSISFFIKFHPHIIDSLFAIAILLEYLIIFNVGFKPFNPTIALIV